MKRRLPAFSQQGMALPITLILMVCVTFVALAFAGLYSKRLTLNTSYVDKYNAQYIAETGLNRYLWVLNNDPYNVNTFVAQNNPYQGYSQEGSGYYNIYCTTSLVGNLAPSTLNLTCTGWLNSDPRNQFSFTTTVQAREFNQYLYWTQYEKDSSGAPVYWGPNDVLNGGLFTDDIINTLVDKSSGATPTFNGVVNYNDNNKGETTAVAEQINTTQIPNLPVPQPGAGGIATEFPNCTGNLPQYASYLQLPPNDSALKAIAKDGQGDYYYGRTCIYLLGSMMDVLTYNNGTFVSYTNIPLPKNGVIYVDGTPDMYDNGAIQETSYNPEDKFKPSYGNVFVSGTLTGQLTIVAANNIYLTAADPTNLVTGSPPDPANVNGSSNLVTYTNDTQFNDSNTGATTIGTDMLGLIANNYVMILRWGWPATTANPDGAFCVGISEAVNNYFYNDYSPNSAATVNLNAAILAINFGFEYESYWPTPVGATNLTTDCSYPYNAPSLQITGSIIQKYRGAVAGGDINYQYNGPTELGNGFVKLYYYDDRMQSDMPPYFLQPANSGWGTYGWYMPGTSNNITPTFSQNPSTPQIPPYNPSSPNTDQWSQAKSITVTAQSSTPSPGNPDQMSAVVKTAKGDYNTPQTVTWSRSDPNSTGTTIDADTGLLTAGGTAGTVTVTAKANGSTTPPVTGSTTITVTVTVN